MKLGKASTFILIWYITFIETIIAIQNLGSLNETSISNDEISVAQLPLIDNGTISVAYSINSVTGNPSYETDNLEDIDQLRAFKSRASEFTDSSRSLVSGRQTKTKEDALELEQMQPKSETLGLGKTEWQQIASGDRKFTNPQEEVGEVARDSSGVAAIRGPKVSSGGGSDYDQRQPRKRRASRSNSCEYGKEAAIIEDDRFGGGRDDENSVRPGGSSSVPESVTSARFKRASSNGDSNHASSEHAGRRSKLQMEVEGDVGGDGKTTGAQFSDFDVHMLLGYAFVADSLGRVHRFKLGPYEKASLIQHGHQNFDKQNSLDQNGFGNVSGSIMADSHPNITQSSNESPSFGLNIATNNIQFRAHDNDARKQSSGRVHANEVDNKADVSHEQSGRHPSASGPSRLFEQHYGVEASLNSGNLEAFSNVPLRDIIRPEKKQQSSESVDDGSKPRIIWSRTKHSPIALSVAGAHPSRRASPNAANQPVETDFESDQNTDNQLANETLQASSEQSNGGTNSDDYQQSQPINSLDGASSNHAGQAVNFVHGFVNATTNSHHLRHLRTELAVDWLNNLVFVLDKYRLIVIDFDGNNELLLIDDFNSNNRPIDIKVDPVNDFLFWLQVGNFHNTIYKLDLNVLSMANANERMRLTNGLRGNLNGYLENKSQQSSSEFVALISHHYAHPIITNLPKSTTLFTVDQKHSRIYVPLSSSVQIVNTNGQSNGHNESSSKDDTEVFASIDGLTITHMNSSVLSSTNASESSIYFDDEKNCKNSTSDFQSGGQILAYNLDGTDVGPLRESGDKSHLTTLDDMQDLTIDSDKGYLYWLTNGGKDLFEEYKTDSETKFYSAQHNLNGKKYSKLIHFGTNQPTHLKPRFNLKNIMQVLSNTNSNLRGVRSDGSQQVDDSNGIAFIFNERHRSSSELNNFKSSNIAPILILSIACLIIISVYLVYTLIFQQTIRQHQANNDCNDGANSDSSINSECHVDCEVATTSNAFINTSTISKWINAKSSTSASRCNGSSIFNRNSSTTDKIGSTSSDVDLTNYNASNAIDEHYRDMVNNQSLFDIDTSKLANLNEWPASMLDMSNKLYVPVEIMQDEELASIRRVSIDQLEIERKAPLGEGHFGTVLQGTIRCSNSEKMSYLNKQRNFSLASPIETNFSNSLLISSPANGRRIPVPPSVSSGHGSSSTSSEFVTANSANDTSNCDYLTPKSNYENGSDYTADNFVSMIRSDDEIQFKDKKLDEEGTKTKLKVAIKKLKENASLEEKRDFLQEAKLLSNFDHPNIVHLIGICLDRGSTLIVMELMLGGDLIRYMLENSPGHSNNVENLTYDDLLKICLDIVNGCCYLEELNYIHRDLAARNCLVSSWKREERIVKLADFGLARDIYKTSYYKKINDSAMPLKWMAPECLSEQKFTTMSDVWSFGVVMWEIMSFCREKPYGNVEPFFMKEHLARGARLSKPEICDDYTFRLMNECWQLEPRRRPTFQDCRATLIEIKNNKKK